MTLTESDIKPGTILCDDDGCQHLVLFRRRNLWLLSRRNSFGRQGHLWTLTEMNERNNRVIGQAQNVGHQTLCTWSGKDLIAQGWPAKDVKHARSCPQWTDTASY